MSKTIENLKNAFAGESQANRKYLAFAEKAEADGYPQIARMFRAIAHGETKHAISHFKAMGGVNSTLENLTAARNGEDFEVYEMYPPYVADAEQEENRKAFTSFKWAMEVEKVHSQLYTKAIEELQANKQLDTQFDYYVCPFCGYVQERSAPDRCPVCGTPGSKFECIA